MTTVQEKFKYLKIIDIYSWWHNSAISKNPSYKYV